MAPSGSREAVSRTVPKSLNFIALPMRLSRTLAQRQRIGSQRRRYTPGHFDHETQPALGGLRNVAAPHLIEEAPDVDDLGHIRIGGLGLVAHDRSHQARERPRRSGDALDLRPGLGVERGLFHLPDRAHDTHERPTDVMAQHRQLTAFGPHAGRVLAPVQKGVDGSHVVLAPATRLPPT